MALLRKEAENRAKGAENRSAGPFVPVGVSGFRPQQTGINQEIRRQL